MLKRCKSTCRRHGQRSTTLLEEQAHDAVAFATSAHQGGPLTIAIFYSTGCSFCLAFIQEGLGALLSIGLPGSAVKVSLVPMDPVSQRREHLCLLRKTRLHSVAVDAGSLRQIHAFLSCYLALDSRDRVGERQCADQVGESWSDIEHCAKGEEGQHLQKIALVETGYVKRLLGSRGFQTPPGIPWIFVDGNLLRCSGWMCNHMVMPGRDGELVEGGGSISFVEYVCKLLSPAPAACSSSAAQPQVQWTPLKRCEKCFLDSRRPLFGTRPGSGPSVTAAAVAGGAALTAVVLAGSLRGWLTSSNVEPRLTDDRVLTLAAVEITPHASTEDHNSLILPMQEGAT